MCSSYFSSVESQRRRSQSNHGSCDSGIVEFLIPRTNSGLKAALFGGDLSNVLSNLDTNRPTKRKAAYSSKSSKPIDVVHNKVKYSATGTLSHFSSCEWSDTFADCLSRTSSHESVNKSIISNDPEPEESYLECNDSEKSPMSFTSSFSDENISELISPDLDKTTAVDDTAVQNYSTSLSPNSPNSPLSTASGVTCTFERAQPTNSDEKSTVNTALNDDGNVTRDVLPRYIDALPCMCAQMAVYVIIINPAYIIVN